MLSMERPQRKGERSPLSHRYIGIAPDDATGFELDHCRGSSRTRDAFGAFVLCDDNVNESFAIIGSSSSARHFGLRGDRDTPALHIMKTSVVVPRPVLHLQGRTRRP